MGTLQTTIVSRTTPKGQTRLYPGIASYKNIGNEELIQFMVNEQGIKSTTAYSAIYALRSLIYNHLLNGHTLTIPRLGTFSLTLKAKGTETPELCTNDTIKSVNIRFTPVKTIKNACRSVRFKGVLTEAEALKIFTKKKTTEQPQPRP